MVNTDYDIRATNAEFENACLQMELVKIMRKLESLGVYPQVTQPRINKSNYQKLQNNYKELKQNYEAKTTSRL